VAELTKLESKLAEVIGLAMAAQGATEKVEKLVTDRRLSSRLKSMRKEAADAEKRGTAVASRLAGKKGAILKEARATKKKATSMMSDYLERNSDGLDGFEFLTMAEAGEVGHWAVLGELNKKARNAEIRELVRWQLPIQRQHLKDVQQGCLTLAGKEDPDETG
jgi:glycyl-tRNA synthetase beta subunit